MKENEQILVIMNYDKPFELVPRLLSKAFSWSLIDGWGLVYIVKNTIIGAIFEPNC